MAAVTLSSCALVVLAARGWLLLDDFNTVGSRLAMARSVGWWPALNAPHNDHWSAGFFAVHMGLVSLFGLDSTVPMAVLAVGSVAVVVVLVRSAMRRVGECSWVADVWPLTLFWWGSAPMAVLWGFDAVFTLAEAVVIGVALLLRDERRWSTTAAAGGLLLVGATLQGSVLIGGVVVLVVWVVAGADRAARRVRGVAALATVAPAVLATLVWRLLVSGPAVVWTRLPGEPDPYNVGPRLSEGSGYAVSLGRRVLSGFVPWSGPLPVVWISALVVGAGLVRTIVVRRGDRRAWPVIVGLPSAAAVLLLTIGVARVGARQGPDVSRYLHLATALLFPVAGLAVGDLIRAAGRLAARYRRSVRGLAGGLLAIAVIGPLVVVGAARTIDAAAVARHYSASSRERIRGILDDPLVDLVPRSMRVGAGTLDLTVGHVVDLGAAGLVTPAAASLRERAESVVAFHVRRGSADGADLPLLSIVVPGTEVPGSCISWSANGRVDVAVVLEPGVTGTVTFSEVPRSVSVRATVDGASSQWSRLGRAQHLAIDGVAGATVELRLTGPWSTC